MKARPPIEGVPAERPRCPWCNKPLGIRTRDTEATVEGRRRVVRREFLGWNSYRGLFDRLSCALEFACASHRGGFRRQVQS